MKLNLVLELAELRGDLVADSGEDASVELPFCLQLSTELDASREGVLSHPLARSLFEIRDELCDVRFERPLSPTPRRQHVFGSIVHLHPDRSYPAPFATRLIPKPPPPRQRRNHH